VSISNAQREPLSWLNWLGTVYHDLPEDLYRFRESLGKYLAFLVWIKNLRVGHGAVDLLLQCRGDDVSISIDRCEGNVEILTMKYDAQDPNR
jgi:hypothetical protein